MLGAMLTCALVRCESFREFVQADVTDGEVVEGDRDIAGLIQLLRLSESASEQIQRLAETIPTIWATRSRTVGMPSGRSCPLALGM